MNWTEKNIAAYLARFIFQRKSLVVVPNCSWPQNECDILAVTMNLRIIDVEVKISRGDFRADAAKDKWFHHWNWKLDGPYDPDKRRPRRWPHRIWKHYYCLPREVWKGDADFEIMPSTASGLLLIDRHHNGDPFLRVERKAQPDRGAERLSPEDAIDIARLASLRMWDALDALQRRAA